MIFLIRPMTDMPKRPRDANPLAKFIVDVATGEPPLAQEKTDAQRKGGVKGGKKRAEILTPGRRSEIARKAAAKQWKNNLVNGD